MKYLNLSNFNASNVTMMFIFNIYSEYYNYYLFLIKNIRHSIILNVFHNNDLKSYYYIFLEQYTLDLTIVLPQLFSELRFFWSRSSPKKKTTYMYKIP